MIIDLEQVAPGQMVELAFREAVPAGDEATSPAADGVTFPLPEGVSFPLVEGRVRVSRAGDRFRVDGEVAGSAALVCSRCLRPFDHTVAARFIEEFGPELEAPGPARRELTDEDVVEALPGATLDVTEIFRQHLVLAAPLAPLCREDCRGLCSRCGADLNDGACACGTESEDPRLEPLRDLRLGTAEGPSRRRETAGGA